VRAAAGRLRARAGDFLSPLGVVFALALAVIVAVLIERLFGRGGVLAVFVAASLWPDAARAEISLPCIHTEHTLAGSLIKPGADRLAIVGVRLQATCEAPLGLQAFFRADGTAIGDGAAAAAGATDIGSFQDVEVYAGVTRPIAAGVGPALLFGWTVPLEAGRPALLERTPRSAFVGALGRWSWGWALVGGGVHQAAGDGDDVPKAPRPPTPWKVSDLRLIAAGQVHVYGRTGLAGEVVAGENAFARGYITVRVGGP
jgi:hypothetical protein